MSQSATRPMWPMRGADVDGKTQRWFIYISLGATPIFLVGMLLVRFFPPKSPTMSAAHVAHLYAAHSTQSELGAMLLMFSALLYATFGAIRIPWVWRLEAGRFPVYTVLSVFCIAMDCALVELCFTLFGVIGYRANDLPPEITRSLLDIVEFLMIFPVAPIMGGMIAFGLAILRDEHVPTIFPRWLGWANFGAAGASFGAATIGFTKSGPFAWNGFFGFWLVLIAFGVWENFMAVCLLRAISAEEQRQGEAQRDTQEGDRSSHRIAP